MKFVYALIFLIAITHAIEINKITKKRKSKENGSGSWETGFDCKGGIEIRRGSNNFVNEGSGKFYAKEVVLPTTEATKAGFCFDMDKTPGNTLKLVMDQVSGNKWCFSYRKMSNTNWTYYNPPPYYFGFKVLNGMMTTDDGVSYNIKINLPYAKLTWLISDEEGNSLVHFLNQWKSDAHFALKAAKKEASSCGNTYITHYKLLEASKGSSELLNAEKLRIANELKSIEGLITTQKKNLDDKETEISTLLEQIQTKTNEKAKLIESSNSIGQDKVEKEKALKIIEETAGNKEKILAELNKSVNDNQGCVDAQMIVLEAQAPQPEPMKYWKAAKDALFTKHVMAEFTQNLGRVFP